jgi:hypothetical protein
LVAQPHAPDLANHVHGDHLESLLKFSAGQWNTPVNIGLALCGLAGQDCIGTNNQGSSAVPSRYFENIAHCGPKQPVAMLEILPTIRGKRHDPTPLTAEPGGRTVGDRLAVERSVNLNCEGWIGTSDRADLLGKPSGLTIGMFRKMRLS